MACALFPGAFGESHHHVMVDGAEGGFGAGLFDRGAQAAESHIDPATELGQEHHRVTHRVFQARMRRQGFARRGKHAGDGGLIEQAVEQQFARKASGPGEQDM